MNLRRRIRLGKHQLTLSVDETPNIPTIGITNECEDNAFRLFLDYDNADYEKVCKDIYHLHKLFKLCSFVILVNNEEIQNNLWGEEKQVGNYNVFGFDRLTWKNCLIAQGHTRCDFLYKTIARRWSQRNWVLRIAGKYEILDGKIMLFKVEPQIKDVIKFPGSCPHIHCKGQYEFFKRWFPSFPSLHLGAWDNCETVEYIEYSTLKKKKG